MSLSDNAVKLAHEMITKGQSRDKKERAKVARLSKEIKLEDVFDQLKGDSNICIGSIRS